MRLRAAIVLLLLALATPGAAQSVRVVAVADLWDDTVDGALINAPRLSGDLQVYLAWQARGRFRVVAVDDVRAAMRARGYKPADLVSPSRSVEIAQAVGAEWLVTGRWHALDLEREHIPGMRFAPIAQAMIEIRVLEVSGRRILLDEFFSGGGAGFANVLLLRQAARAALQRAAARISGL